MPRILVIDDDSAIRKMLKKSLERSGYEVMAASDGQKGLDLHKETPADLIITDVIMPNKEGLETIIEFRRDFPGVKIIAISGGGEIGPEGYLKAAMAFGADKALAKPLELKELVKVVEKLLGLGN
jgi:DNA-binding response OmpR family regulator